MSISIMSAASGRIQQMTGALLYASQPAAKVFETGTAGVGDPQAGMHKPLPVCAVDQIVGDGSIVRLGDLYLTAIATPGPHARRASWHWGACDVGDCRRSSTPTASRRSAETITGSATPRLCRRLPSEHRQNPAKSNVRS
jgi:hypothetical protein